VDYFLDLSVWEIGDDERRRKICEARDLFFLKWTMVPLIFFFSFFFFFF